MKEENGGYSPWYYIAVLQAPVAQPSIRTRHTLFWSRAPAAVLTALLVAYKSSRHAALMVTVVGQHEMVVLAFSNKVPVHLLCQA